MMRGPVPAWMAVALGCLGLSARAAHAGTESVDLLLTGGKIYTADARHSLADSLAVREGRILAVGSAADLQRFVGPTTRVETLGGRLVLPSLFDSHVHPIGMIKVDSCDLENRARSLRDLSEFARDCLHRHPVPAGGWLSIHQWNPSNGNQPDADLPTLVAALDRVSTSVAIQLIGSDGHHGAFNSAALARAHGVDGRVIGFSKSSLAAQFLKYRNLVGVDVEGNPNGAVNEDAKALMGAPGILSADLDRKIAARAQIPELLNSAGITGILDAKVDPSLLALYDALDREHRLSFRVTLAQFYDPESFRLPNGHVDFETMISLAAKVRANYASHPLIRADFVKLFADGVLEGNPYAVPPTLPNTLALKPYLQPRFSRDEHGQLTVVGYVDLDSAVCVDARRHPERFQQTDAIRAFMAHNGFHPGQCAMSSGQLRHDRATILEFARLFHRAGFSLHIHAIGDGSIRTAVDAIEAARAGGGVSTTHDGLAHVQLAQARDVARIGRDHLYVAFTYSWANTDPEYDMTVVPFIDRVSGNRFESLHASGNYSERNAYPFKAVREAGGILVGGSDAPVNSRDPQPFVNIATALTRRLPGLPPKNPAQVLSITEALDSYTINGARFLNREREAGSLEVGKCADFIVLDRDVLALAASGREQEIRDTRVLKTWFAGRLVYERLHP